MTTIDLNCDLGEDPAAASRDETLAGLVTSLNIACGGHAGDDASMRRMLALAVRLGRAAGAHPSYPDRAGFGRMTMEMPRAALTAALRAQLARFAELAAEAGVAMSHVKPHGALYHAAAHRPDVAGALFDAMGEATPGAAAVLPWGAPAAEWAAARGVRVFIEAFADRRYLPDGGLAPRGEADALLNADAAAAQAVSIALGRGVMARGGVAVPVRAETICVHADTPDAVEIARRVRARLESASVALAPSRLR